MTGRPISDEECEAAWAAWTPAEVAEKLEHVSAPWCVVAGWALEFFTANAARPHADLEIAVPRGRFDELAAAFPGFEWDTVGANVVWPFPEQVDHTHQTWLREPATGRYRLDVFREPHDGDQWTCRRDPTITLSYDELILRTSDGIPFVVPEVALLFKAKANRPKDDVDFRHVLPALDAGRRARLGAWLRRVHPGHPWLADLD